MCESFMKYDKKNPPAGVDKHGRFTGSGGYYIWKDEAGDAYVVAPGTYEALKDMIVNDRVVQFVLISKNDLGVNVYPMNFVSLGENGVIQGNASADAYAFEVNPDNTGFFEYAG